MSISIVCDLPVTVSESVCHIYPFPQSNSILYHKSHYHTTALLPRKL